MNKRYAVAALFLGALLTLGVLTAALPQRDYSPQENRYLSRFPALSWSGILDGTVSAGITDAMSDQFPVRERIVSTATVFRRLLGARDVGGAYLGEEGHCFQQITESDIDRQRYERNLGYIRDYAEEGRAVSVLLVPDAGTVLPDLLPPYAPMYDADSLYAAAEELLGDRIIDVRAELTAAGADAYYKTDHHWTSYGAYTAFCKAMADSGEEMPAYADAGFVTVSEDFYGTLYSKTLDPDATPDAIALLPREDVTVTVDGQAGSLYVTQALERKDQYQVFQGGNYGLVTLEGRCRNGKTILVIKDSFANCYVPFLTDCYERVLMVDLRYYGGSVRALAEAEQVTETLFLFQLSSFANSQEFARIVL